MFTQIVVKKYLNIQGVKFHSFSLTEQRVFLPFSNLCYTYMYEALYEELSTTLIFVIEIVKIS